MVDQVDQSGVQEKEGMCEAGMSKVVSHLESVTIFCYTLIVFILNLHGPVLQ
jgi:hypothetical protein